MKAKTAIGVAVAAALSWSYGAMANGGEHMGMHERGSMHERMSAHEHRGLHERATHARSGMRGSDRTFEVATPFSPNQAGPSQWPQDERVAAAGIGDAHASALEHEVITPLASNESGPNDEMLQQRVHRFDVASSGAMANPQTPWSPNEAGVNAYDEDMRAHEQQVAQFEEARIAAADWNARIAADSSQHYFGDREGAGATAGLGVQGSTGGYGTDERSAWNTPDRDLRSDASLPPEADRTSALRSESEYVVPANEPATVAVLEVPVEPNERTVWNVEPLTPQADLTQGATVYPAPQTAPAPEGAPLQDREASRPAM